jgi:hypothetical protein
MGIEVKCTVGLLLSDLNPNHEISVRFIKNSLVTELVEIPTVDIEIFPACRRMDRTALHKVVNMPKNVTYQVSLIYLTKMKPNERRTLHISTDETHLLNMRMLEEEIGMGSREICNYVLFSTLMK